MSFYLSGGVEVLGFISPTEITDEYPVIDPLYGIDGLRNVDLLGDLNTIPTPRRRPGMIVGVSGGTQYYKLNSPPWNNTISDWSIFNSGGGSFTGGTVTGNTIFTNGLSATTISATTIGTSGDCVDDIYVSNIHSCSPLNINPLDEGNVYFGSTSGVTFDLINNKVGIGTSTPNTIFHVVGNYTGGTDALIPQMLFQNSNTIPNTNKTAIIRTTVGTGYVVGGYPEIWLESQETSTGVGLTKLRTVSNHPLLFYTNDLERVRLTETGNFGINTPSPAGKLHIRTGVNKNIIFTSGATGNQIRSLVDGNAAYTGLDLDSLNLNLKTNGLDRVVVDSSGNVGIGTTTPSEKLEIDGVVSIGKSTLGAPYNPTVIDDIIDPINSAVTATIIYPKNFTNKRIFFGKSNRKIYDLVLTDVFSGVFDVPNVSIRGGKSLYWTNGLAELKNDAGTPLEMSSYYGFQLRDYFNTDIARLGYSPTNNNSTFFGNVGIGTTTPTERLDVSGKTKTINLQVTSGATAGYVLTALDSSGNTKWEALGSTSNELDPVLTITGTTASTVNIGDRFLISGGTGIWLGKDNQIAEYTGVTPTDYSYYIPVIDDVVFVTDTLTTYRFDGTNWVSWRGTAILQNGNSLTTSVNIGSNNNKNLTLRTSGQTRVNIDTSGTTNILGKTNLVQQQGSDFLTFSSSTPANSGQTMYIRQTAPSQYVFGSVGPGIGAFMRVGPNNVVNFEGQTVQSLLRGASFGSSLSNPVQVPYAIQIANLPSQSTGTTSNVDALRINPSITTTATYTGTYRGIYYNPTVSITTGTTHLAIETVRGDVIFGSTSGNVGIGTATPTAKLQVSGTTLLQTFTGNTGLISAATQNVLTIVGSGNSTTSPIFTVQGSSGELFSVSDSLVGSLFSVNDISGLPILEVFSDNTTLMGSYLAPSLNTTARVIATTGTTNVYSIPTSAYTGAFFDYTVSDGTNLRAGNIMSIWSGTSVNITETQTTDFGNTSGLTFNMVVSSGNAILRTSGTTGNWTVKTIVRSI